MYMNGTELPSETLTFLKNNISLQRSHLFCTNTFINIIMCVAMYQKSKLFLKEVCNVQTPNFFLVGIMNPRVYIAKQK